MPQLLINHWADKCPDKGSDIESVNEALYNIVMFEEDLECPESIKSLVYDTMGCAVLDCGAAKTVCGKAWLSAYIDSLSKGDKAKVVHLSSSHTFMFGNRKRVKSLELVHLPVAVGRKKATLVTDVVDDDIPSLGSELLHGGGANAAGGTGDDGDPTYF